MSDAVKLEQIYFLFPAWETLLGGAVPSPAARCTSSAMTDCDPSVKIAMILQLISEGFFFQEVFVRQNSSRSFIKLSINVSNSEI